MGNSHLELQMSCLLSQVCGCQTQHCGWGAVAVEAIKKDEFVIEYTGEGNRRIHKAQTVKGIAVLHMRWIYYVCMHCITLRMQEFTLNSSTLSRSSVPTQFFKERMQLLTYQLNKTVIWQSLYWTVSDRWCHVRKTTLGDEGTSQHLQLLHVWDCKRFHHWCHQERQCIPLP